MSQAEIWLLLSGITKTKDYIGTKLEKSDTRNISNRDVTKSSNLRVLLILNRINEGNRPTCSKRSDWSSGMSRESETIYEIKTGKMSLVTILWFLLKQRDHYQVNLSNKVYYHFVKGRQNYEWKRTCCCLFTYLTRHFESEEGPVYRFCLYTPRR